MQPADAAALIGRLPEAYLLVRADGRIEAANAQAGSVLGRAAAQLPGAALSDLVGDDPETVNAYLRRCHASGTLLPGQLHARSSPASIPCRGCALPAGTGGERLVLLRLEPEGGVAGQFTALTDKVEELTKEAHRRRRTEQELREAQRRTTFLAEASRVLGSSLDYEETLRNVARLSVPEMADWCAVDLLAGPGRIERVAVEHPDPERVRLAMDLHERYPPKEEAEYGIFAVMRSGRGQFMAEIPEGLLEATAVDEEHLRIIRGLQLRSFIVAPLKARDATLGAITFVFAESGRRYDEDDVALLEDVARRAATAIDNARLVAAIERARLQIEEQATELEAQTEELQLQSAQLEQQAAELEHQVDEVEALNVALISTNEQLSLAHRESELARREAERASTAKSQFLAVMSHELRTPMNAILGYTDLLDAEIAGPLTEQQKTHLSRVRASSLHLLRLIDQVLSLARIEAGREDVILEKVDVVAVVEEVAGMVDPLAARRGLRLAIDTPRGAPPVLTDAGKLRQILLNLIGNAIKFTDAGRVDVLVALDRDELRVDVADTGRGIDADDFERIFNAFEQVDQSITRRVEGTGLGLPVSRELARLLGGDVTVQSEVGRGSTFTLTLPLHAASEAGAAGAAGAAEAPAHETPSLRAGAGAGENTAR